MKHHSHFHQTNEILSIQPKHTTEHQKADYPKGPHFYNTVCAYKVLSATQVSSPTNTDNAHDVGRPSLGVRQKEGEKDMLIGRESHDYGRPMVAELACFFLLFCVTSKLRLSTSFTCLLPLLSFLQTPIIVRK